MELTTIGLFVVVGVTLLYALYSMALPRPLGGIPYNKSSAKSIFGDFWLLLKHISATKEMFSWLSEQNAKLQSPITQVFIQPLSKPWVVITDYREAQEILSRRTKEFDRSDFISNLFATLIPDAHVRMKSTNPKLGYCKKLALDSMSPVSLKIVS